MSSFGQFFDIQMTIFRRVWPVSGYSRASRPHYVSLKQGYQIWTKSVSDRLKIRQIWDFILGSDFSKFSKSSEIWSEKKNPGFVLFSAQLTHFKLGPKSDIPALIILIAAKIPKIFVRFITKYQDQDNQRCRSGLEFLWWM